MVIPYLVGALATGASHLITKKTKDDEMKEKLELVKDLAKLTPDQAKAVDAMKEQDVEEMKVRRDLGIGPLKPLPPQASERAREARAAAHAKKGTDEGKVAAKLKQLPPGDRDKAMAKMSEITPEERVAILNAPDREKAIKAVVDAKLADVARRIK